MGFFDWVLKKFFSIKSKKVLEEKQKQLPPKVSEVSKKEKEEVELNDFQKLIKNLEENRGEVIKHQEEGKPKMYYGDEISILEFQGEKFGFDQESLDFYNEEFNKKGYTIIKVPSKNGSYLARENNETGKISYFHISLMEKEIEDFCFENKCDRKEVVVHHKKFNPSINMRKDLQVMTENEHNKLHNR